MATSLYKAQIPLRRKGQTTCTYHQGRQLDHYCEECKVPVCVKCVTTVHTCKSHPMCALSEITPQNKKKIQRFVDKTEQDGLVQIGKYIADTDKHLKDNASKFEKLSNNLKAQTNKLKDDLDLLTAQNLSLYKQMEEDNAKLLQTYKRDLEMYSTRLKQQLQECKKALQCGSDIKVYDAGCEVQTSVTLPMKPTLGTASFIPNRSPQKYLVQAFGEVITSGQALKRHDRSVGSFAGRTPSSTQQRSDTKGRKNMSNPVDTLLHQTKVLEEWKPPCYITSVCPTNDGQMWTCSQESKTLTLLDKTGKVIQKVKHKTKINDIGLSPTSNTLWVCDWNGNITELVSGRLEHRFSTLELPLCICITAGNHVIVGMGKHIFKFTSECELVLATPDVGHGKPFVCKPYRISECPVTHNVAVADKDDQIYGGEGKPRVIVMDTDFKELFVYNGDVQSSYSRSEPFDSYDLVYDSVGNLVICDCHRILLISGSGEFIRILHTDDVLTWAVGAHKDGFLWAVFGASNVKLLQYSV